MQKIDVNNVTCSFQHCTRVVRLLQRSQMTLRQAVSSIEVLETMHPSEFLEFRDYLTPASGLQSVQFRSLEQLLGLPNAMRAHINNASVFSYLDDHEQEKLKAEADEPSINEVLLRLLLRL
uniref:Tryptophan 2,3-dioxygenase n=1 Tax=Lygus hesperus TaxID=30085 RepID=A0A0A9XZZ9_LYGHE